MQYLGIRERLEVQEDGDPRCAVQSNGISDAAPRPDQLLETACELKALWDKVKTLPIHQRKALLLNLRGRRSEGLINVLPLNGIASVREIAAVLEFDPTDFAAIWNSLPWDDLQIAEHLGLTRQQVINLRQAARAKLARR